MSSLPLRLDRALRRFSKRQTIQVVDVEGRNEGGRWKVSTVGERRIRAIVLAMEIKTLEFLSAGDASASGINVMTREELYSTDIKTTDDGSEYIDGRQSFVLYKGYKFRVTSDGFTMGNTIFNSYNCLRYLEQEQ